MEFVAKIKEDPNYVSHKLIGYQSYSNAFLIETIQLR